MQQLTWVLVCDASHARLFQAASGDEKKGDKKGDKRAEKLTLLDHMEHAESRAHGRDLTSDAPGRKPAGPVGAFGRPGAEPDTDPKEVEAQKFARQLAERLAKGLNDHAYERLIMTAPPHFLGLMRAAVSTQVEKHVGATLDKDLTHLDTAEIARRLEDVLEPN